MCAPGAGRAERVRPRCRREDRHRGLGQDRAGIHLLGDQMDGAAVQLHPSLQRSGMGVQAGKGGNRLGWMFEHAALPGLTRTGVSSRM